jgi:hypothetical protein
MAVLAMGRMEKMAEDVRREARGVWRPLTIRIGFAR